MLITRACVEQNLYRRCSDSALLMQHRDSARAELNAFVFVMPPLVPASCLVPTFGNPCQRPPGIVVHAPGAAFVQPGMRKGILPSILAALISARAATRAALKEATAPAQRAVLDSRQKALKLTANALYGFTGARLARLAPGPPLPASCIEGTTLVLILAQSGWLLLQMLRLHCQKSSAVSHHLTEEQWAQAVWGFVPVVAFWTSYLMPLAWSVP